MRGDSARCAGSAHERPRGPPLFGAHTALAVAPAQARDRQGAEMGCGDRDGAAVVLTAPQIERFRFGTGRFRFLRGWQ